MSKLFTLLPQGHQLLSQSFQVACSNLPRTASTATSALLVSIAGACLYGGSPYKQVHRAGFVFTASLLMGGARYYASKCAAAAFAATATAMVVSAIALITFSLVSKLKKPLTNYLLRCLGVPTSNREALKKFLKSDFFKNLKMPENAQESIEIFLSVLREAGAEDVPETVTQQEFPDLVRRYLPKEFRPLVDKFEERFKQMAPREDEEELAEGPEVEADQPNRGGLEVVEVNGEKHLTERSQRQLQAFVEYQQMRNFQRNYQELPEAHVKLQDNQRKLSAEYARLLELNKTLSRQVKKLVAEAPALAAIEQDYQLDLKQFIAELRATAPDMARGVSKGRTQNANVFNLVMKYFQPILEQKAANS